MPEVENLNGIADFIDPIVDQYRGMYEFADARPALYGATDKRESNSATPGDSELFAKPFGCGREIGP